MTQPTTTDVITSARITINDRDADAYRYSNEDLLSFINDGLDEFFAIRPDLFIGSMELAAATEGHQLALGADLPIDGRLKRHLVDYVIFRAETTDDEHANSGRASAFLKQLERRLLG
jgi:hypothetical protein